MSLILRGRFPAVDGGWALDVAEEVEEDAVGVGAEEVEGADVFLRHVHSLSQTGQMSSSPKLSSSWRGLRRARTFGMALFTVLA